MISILLVDDQKSVRERLRSLLETEPDFKIVGMVDNGYDAIEQVKVLAPDVVLMDMEMPDIDGVLATKIITNNVENVKVLVLSSHDSSEYVAKSIYAGAKGYILKGAPSQEIQEAIRFVYRGYTQIAPGLFEKFIPSPEVAIVEQKSSSKTEIVNALNQKDLELTGINLTSNSQIRSSPLNTSDLMTGSLSQDFMTPSEIIDLEPSSIYSKSKSSIGWYQVLAIIVGAIAITTGIYFLRQQLRQSTPTLTPQQQVSKLQDTPFKSKIEAGKTYKINSTIPGFVKEVYVKTGDDVKTGQTLMVIRNVEAERSQQEKAQQQQIAIKQQQLVSLQQQQASLKQWEQQQVELRFQIQQAQERLNQKKQALEAFDQQSPLKNKLANNNAQLATSQNQNNDIAIRQKAEAIKKTKVVYDKALKTYERLTKVAETGAIPQAQVEQAQADMNIAKADWDNAKIEHQQAIATAKKLKEQQQLQIKNVQDQLKRDALEQQQQRRQLVNQIQQAQREYQEINKRLTDLIQQPPQNVSSAVQTVNTTGGSEPILTKITASNNGKVIELPISSGDQVFTGTKLITVGMGKELKINVEVDNNSINLIEIGKPALVKVSNGSKQQEFTGKIYS